MTSASITATDSLQVVRHDAVLYRVMSEEAFKYVYKFEQVY
jgi:hypothetical protein